MFAPALQIAAWKTTIRLAARLAAPRRCPVPLSDVHGRLTALVQSPHGAALVTAIGLVLAILALRSAWLDVFGRWYSR